MDDSDISDTFARFSNICLVQSFISFTRYILLSLVHSSNMSLSPKTHSFYVIKEISTMYLIILRMTLLQILPMNVERDLLKLRKHDINIEMKLIFIKTY